jgi:ribose/xylose/arabinose/galactoside ABC-type transport system permease subunit
MIGEMRVSPLRNLINQVGTSSSYTQQGLSGALLIVVVTAQICLTRKSTF